MREQQNYRNHTRWFPLVHFFLFPLLTINLIWAIVCVVMELEWFRVQYLVLSVGAIGLNFASRMQALRVQDRLIRLEERIRCDKLLEPELAAAASGFRTSQMIALRFASDKELPALVERVAKGELSTQKEIKTAITEWRPDHLRV